MLLALIAGVSAAHDFWIDLSVEAARHQTEPVEGSLTFANCLVGHYPNGEALHNMTQRLAMSVHAPVAHQTGMSEPPLFMWFRSGAMITPPSRHWMQVAFKTKPSRAVMAKEDFLNYLAEEGLGDWRGRLEAEWPFGERDVQEDFYRCAKLVYRDAPEDEAARDTALRKLAAEATSVGLDYELSIVAVELDEGTLSVRAENLGEPATGKSVFLVERVRPDARIEAKTDEAGVATFEVIPAGDFVLLSVDLRRAEPAAAEDAPDFTSAWASLHVVMVDAATNGD